MMLTAPPSPPTKLSRLGMMVALLVMVTLSGVRAQDRCGTVEYTHKLLGQKSLLENKEAFEKWLLEKQSAKFLQRQSGREKLTTYRIPVVVHVIHNGEAIGTGQNISDAQIISQIKVLNDDFRRMNADAVNTPSEYQSVAGSLDIEFVLAQQNPQGTSTNGIVRVQGPKSSWVSDDNYQLKSLSYWPAEDYLNLWVCNLTDYLGYAQLPVSSLPGMENSSGNRLTDGVVVYYRAFGSIDDGNFNLDAAYDKGRTVTHEVGHFLGLRHIWGDDSGTCGNAGDYVADTPDQKDKTSGCPAVHPRPASFRCNDIPPMFQNYMDYTDDACMNLFTQGQFSRVVTVLENSPRRASLLTSHALDQPQPVANNSGIQEIIAPGSSACDLTVVPSVVVRNYGNNTVTSITIQLRIDGVIAETKTVAVSLTPSQASPVTFAQQGLTTGTSTFTFEILQTNGTTDGDSFNNKIDVPVYVPEIVPTPYVENFNTLPPSWKIDNPDNLVGWQNTIAPKETTDNKSMFMNFYDYEDSEGELDLLVSPLIDLSDATIAILYFDVAYARYQSSNDGLRIYVLSDCDPDIYNGTEVYSKSGSTLATTTSTSSFFIPQNNSSWRKEAVNLSAYAGQKIQLAFVGFSDFGNNVYVDNVAIVVDELKDLSITQVKPDMITCNENTSFTVTTTNVGTDPINSFKVSLRVNGATPIVKSFSALDLLSGNSITVTLDPVRLLNGENDVEFEVLEPNDVADANPADNKKNLTVVLNKKDYPVPFKEDFEGSLNDWVIVNPVSPEDGMLWEVTSPEPFGKSIYFNAFNNSVLGDQSWLISPTIDFTAASSASVQFYTSYAKRGEHADNLRLVYSLDCGNSFEPVPLFDGGNDLHVTERASSWVPETAAEWKKHFVAIPELVGKDNVRFAFIATNDSGNNLYLDNINFTNTTEQITLISSGLYSIYHLSDGGPGSYQLIFNLPERQNVKLQILDAMGKSVVNGELRDILNQPYALDLNAYASGVYIIRLGMENSFYSTKIVIAR